MSIMNTQMYDALIEAGTSEIKARAAAEVFGDPKRLTTKEDITTINENINLLKTVTNAEMNLLRWMIGFNLALTSSILLVMII